MLTPAARERNHFSRLFVLCQITVVINRYQILNQANKEKKKKKI